MKLRLITALVLTIVGATQAWADAVLDWNPIAAQTIFAAGRPGPSAVPDLAVVQATVHDAKQASDKRFSRTRPKSPASGSPAAAIATVARTG